MQTIAAQQTRDVDLVRNLNRHDYRRGNEYADAINPGDDTIRWGKQWAYLNSFFFVFLIVFIYFLPTAVATSREHQNAGAIFVLNLFLGWTFLGWVIALVWSGTSNTKRKTPRSTAPPAPVGKPCPHCAGELPIDVDPDACMHCGRGLFWFQGQPFKSEEHAIHAAEERQARVQRRQVTAELAREREIRHRQGARSLAIAKRDRRRRQMRTAWDGFKETLNVESDGFAGLIVAVAFLGVITFATIIALVIIRERGGRDQTNTAVLSENEESETTTDDVEEVDVSDEREGIQPWPGRKLFAKQQIMVRKAASETARVVLSVPAGHELVELSREDDWVEVRVLSMNETGWVKVSSTMLKGVAPVKDAASIKFMVIASRPWKSGHEEDILLESDVTTEQLIKWIRERVENDMHRIIRVYSSRQAYDDMMRQRASKAAARGYICHVTRNERAGVITWFQKQGEHAHMIGKSTQL